jgi:endonuclease/exonuclease/phosphatase family metal-dependent hydrolase
MKWLKRLLIAIIILAGGFILLIAWATLADYKPPVATPAEIAGNAPAIDQNDSIFSIITWNIGYFGLGKECDFFFDGGQMTRPAKDQYQHYLQEALKYFENSEKADFYFFQEVDIYSRRSYFDNQVAHLRKIFPGMESSLALNYVVPFVPVPVNHPMGKVNSGLLSFSAFKTGENTRYAFPTSYSWPVRLFQLDRCFLLTRIELPGDKELVLINTHNEAFDDGSQRTRQMAVLKEMMLQEFSKGNYVIVGGDWNQNPVGYKISGFRNGDLGRTIEPAIEPDFLPQDWQWVFDPEIPSNRDVNMPYEKGNTRTTIIDFFVVSPNVEVLEIKTDDLGFEWCDHQPVEMAFRFK